MIEFCTKYSELLRLRQNSFYTKTFYWKRVTSYNQFKIRYACTAAYSSSWVEFFLSNALSITHTLELHMFELFASSDSKMTHP